MTSSISIHKAKKAIFFLKLSHTQSTDDIRFDTVKYCYRKGYQRSGFFKIKENCGVSEENYIHNILCDIARKCETEGAIAVFTNFTLPLNSFAIIEQSMQKGKLTVHSWNC